MRSVSSCQVKHNLRRGPHNGFYGTLVTPINDGVLHRIVARIRICQIKFECFHHTRLGLIRRRVRSWGAWVLRFSDTNTPQPVPGTPVHVNNNGLNLFELRKLNSALSIKVSTSAEESPPTLRVES